MLQSSLSSSLTEKCCPVPSPMVPKAPRVCRPPPAGSPQAALLVLHICAMFRFPEVPLLLCEGQKVTVRLPGLGLPGSWLHVLPPPACTPQSGAFWPGTGQGRRRSLLQKYSLPALISLSRIRISCEPILSPPGTVHIDTSATLRADQPPGHEAG